MRTPSACRFTRGRLALFPSGDLLRDEHARVQEHLAACPACRRELRPWLDARDALEAVTGPERPPTGRLHPDPAFFDDLQARVLEAVAAPRRRPWRRVGSAAAAAAMFAVGLTVAALAQRDDGRPRLLDFDKIVDPSPSLADPESWVQPVGLGSSDWTGLRGRETADAFLLSFPDPAPETVALPLRSKLPADDR